MKQTRSKQLWLMLAAAMCICILALMGAGSLSKADNAGQMYTYSAAASFVCDANGTITAYKGNKNAEQIIVPATINGRTVTGISNNVFKGCEKVSLIAVPDTIVTIGDRAFENCQSLSTLYSYKKADANDTATATDAAGTATAQGVVVPYAEMGVIAIPSNLKKLGTGAFAGCRSIGRFAAADTNAYFKTYTWNTNNPNQAQIQNKNQGELLLSKDGKQAYRFAPAFHYTGKGLYKIPVPVTTIAPYAFETAALNGGFQIPTTIKVISDYAFYQCGNLNQIEFAKTSNTAIIGAYAFARNSNLQITLPASVTSIGKYSFAYCVNIKIDISKTKIRIIPDYAFYECDNLHELITPKTLEKVGAYVFYGCNNLNEVKFLGKTLKEIGTGAFKTCDNLHVIDVPEGVTKIANGTFDGCHNLNTIKLPDSLKNIGDNAFKNCNNIQEMVIPKNVSHISNNSFAGAKQDGIDTSKNQYSQKFIKAEKPAAVGTKFKVGKLRYKITKSDAKKGTVTLYGAKKSVTKATIPATVMYQGYKFKVTSVGGSAFKNCKKLKTVKLGKNVKSIGKSAFYGCKKLAKVTLDAKLTKIGDKAFAKCTAIKKLTIPKQVSKIGSKAFYGDKKLKTITVKSSKLKKTTIGKSAFTKINKKATISVTKKKVKAYKSAFKKAGAAKSDKVKKIK